MIMSLYRVVYSAENQVESKPVLWVVDGVALTDSIFNYTIEQMQGDSAAIYAYEALRWVYPHSIESIVARKTAGFSDFSGIVEITNLNRLQPLIVLNGIPFNSKGTISPGQAMNLRTGVMPFVRQEFPEFSRYGIKSVCVPYNLWWSSPIIFITTYKDFDNSDFLRLQSRFR